MKKIKETIIGAKGRIALKKQAFLEKKEEGSSELIAVVILVILGLVLALLYKGEITEFLESTFDKLNTQADKLFN